MSSSRPAHHRQDGGFRNPWPTATPRGAGGVLRWQRERRTRTLAPNPPATALRRATPRIALPYVAAGEARITWIGQSSFLIQLPGCNALVDPVFGHRASPVPWAGPRRFAPPGITIEELPPIDLVLLSHDHYDHLDRGSIVRLRRKFGERVLWVTPLGYRGWLRRLRISKLAELDWWASTAIDTSSGVARVQALPAQHWTRRNPFTVSRRLWASFLIEASGMRVYFGGDTGYFPEFTAIGQRAGPFDAVLLPIGAYDPPWFMRPMHMNPEEAVTAYRELGATGVFAAMHWGTFRLSDEDPLEPPARLQDAWRAARLNGHSLWIPALGETRFLQPACPA
ncbi:MAG: MBL fold metallo-hydrolase [Longimicrobiales bacterium]